MGVAVLNEYQLIFSDNHSEIFMAANMRSAFLTEYGASYGNSL
jgi:hypothetical protein